MMKKYLNIVFLFTILVSLTGCAKEKQLECSKVDTKEGMTMNQTINVTFKNSNVSNLKLNIDVQMDEKYQNYIDIMVENVESSFKKYNDKKGVKINNTKKENGFMFSFEGDLKEMDKDTKESLDMINTKLKYSDAKKELENDGYTCK